MNDGRNTIEEKIAENLNIVLNAVQEILENSTMKEVMLASVIAALCDELNIDKKTEAFMLLAAADFDPENMSEQEMQQEEEIFSNIFIINRRLSSQKTRQEEKRQSGRG